MERPRCSDTADPSGATVTKSRRIEERNKVWSNPTHCLVLDHCAPHCLGSLLFGVYKVVTGERNDMKIGIAAMPSRVENPG